INHYSGIELRAEGFVISYVIDMAEIPALQEKEKLDFDGDGAVGEDELKRYASSAAARLSEGLRLSLDEQRIFLTVKSASATMPPGAGGLATLRLECSFTAHAPEAIDSQTHRVRFEDQNFEGRIGWREIVVNQSSTATIFD